MNLCSIPLSGVFEKVPYLKDRAFYDQLTGPYSSFREQFKGDCLVFFPMDLRGAVVSAELSDEDLYHFFQELFTYTLVHFTVRDSLQNGDVKAEIFFKFRDEILKHYNGNPVGLMMFFMEALGRFMLEQWRLGGQFHKAPEMIPVRAAYFCYKAYHNLVKSLRIPIGVLDGTLSAEDESVMRAILSVISQVEQARRNYQYHDIEYGEYDWPACDYVVRNSAVLLTDYFGVHALVTQLKEHGASRLGQVVGVQGMLLARDEETLLHWRDTWLAYLNHPETAKVEQILGTHTQPESATDEAVLCERCDYLLRYLQKLEVSLKDIVKLIERRKRLKISDYTIWKTFCKHSGCPFPTYLTLQRPREGINFEHPGVLAGKSSPTL